jgi:hypothetical protein
MSDSAANLYDVVTLGTAVSFVISDAIEGLGVNN